MGPDLKPLPHSLRCPSFPKSSLFLGPAPLGSEWPSLKPASAGEWEGQGHLPCCSQLPLHLLAWLRALEEAMFMCRLRSWQEPGTWPLDWVGGSCASGPSQ